MKKIVIALGGNAILRKGESVSIETQINNINKALEKVFPIIKNNKVVITHGNGPQAGYLLLQQEIAIKGGERFPLDVIDAETEGQIGYLIQQNLQNIFARNKIDKAIVAILTQVLVSGKDEAFNNPSKFIGPFYTKREADKLRRKFIIKKDSDRGYRRVVASPKALGIVEFDIIKKMMKDEVVVIAAGGGGIPVTKNGSYEGIECVVDKDVASECLASSIKADELIIVTDVDKVYLNYGKRNQKALRKVKVGEMEMYYKQGHFPKGSMGPKVKASIDFLRKGGKRVVIGNVDTIKKGGTVVER